MHSQAQGATGELSLKPWQGNVIELGPPIPRPDDHFSPDLCVVCRIGEEEYVPGKVVETLGNPPFSVRICMNVSRFRCSGGTEFCESCKLHHLTTTDNGAVLSLLDLDPFLTLDTKPLSPENPLYGIMDCEKAAELFGLIDSLGKRQKSC